MRKGGPVTTRASITPPGLATRAPQNPAPAGHYAPRDPTSPQFTDAPASPFLTVPEACGVLRVGRATLYDFFTERRLTRCKLGAKTLIPRASVDRLIAELLAEAEGTR
jgi:excisionase family DNA binding protein